MFVVDAIGNYIMTYSINGIVTVLYDESNVSLCLSTQSKKGVLV